MPKRVRPEFYWIESKQLYRKRVKCKDGGWHDAYGRTKEICRQRAKELEILEKLETVTPILESGLIYNLLFQEFYQEDIQNFKKLFSILIS